MHRLSAGFASKLVAITALSSLVGLVAVAQPAQAAPRIGHGAVAYGTSVQLSSVFTSGPTALATLGCTNRAGVDHVNSAASGGLLAAGTVGAINDEVSTTSSGTTATSNVQSIGLFSNLITADAATATATTTTNGAGFTNSGGTTVANLVINGTPVTLPAPNTVIPLTGLGTLTVNEQIARVTGDAASMIVNALHLHIDVTNAFGFPVGTDLVVGHARSALDKNPNRLLDGRAYGTQIVGIGAASGKTALVHLPCQGTGGEVRTNTTAGTVIPNVISTGTETSTATGTTSKSAASGATSATIQTVSLLNIISADTVSAKVSASMLGKVRTFADTSTFGNISVLGIPTLPDPVPPNSQYAIPGVGTLYLHRVIQHPKKIEVRMIELVLAVPVGPLAVGTDIQIGVAEVSVH